MKSKSFLFFYFLLLSLCAWSHHHEKIALTEQKAVNVSKYLYLLYDSSSVYTFSQINSEEFIHKFYHNKQRNPNITNIKGTVWGRLTIQNNTNSKWVIEVSESALDTLIFYHPNELNTGYSSQRMGMFFPDETKDYHVNRYVIDLNIPANSEKTFFFRIHSRRLQFPMKLMPVKQFVELGHKRDLLNGMYYGMMLLMLLYNLLLLLATKDKNYFYYIIYLFTSCFYVAWIKGHVTEFVIYDWLWLNKYGVAFASISTLTSIIFAVNFLNIKVECPKNWYRIYKGIGLLLLIPFISILIGIDLIAFKSIQIIAGLSFLVIFSSGIYVWIKANYKPARFFVLAWGGFIIGMLVYILKTANALPLNEWTANAMQLGSSWEMLMLAFALADKINFYKDQIKDSELKIREINDRLRKQNTRLEEHAFMISHNLRGPVASILGMVSLYDRANVDNEFNPQVIGYIDTAANDLDVVVKDLNESIKIIQNLDTEFTTVSIQGILLKIQQKLKVQIDEIQPEMKIDLMIDTIVTDKNYLESILINLLENALIFRKKQDNLVVQIQTERMTMNDKDFCCITFSDNGIGINMKLEKEKIFKFHYKGVHSEGNGVGLYLVRSQVESLDGKIEVDSEVGVGSTFFVYLPIFERDI